MKNSLLICCVVALLFYSCQQEYNPDEHTDHSAIVLKMRPETTSTITLATESGNDLLKENKIDNMHVFIFPANAANNQLCVDHEYFTNLAFQGTGTLAKELTVSRNSFTAGASYDIYTLVNLPADVFIPGSITLGTIKSLHSLTQISSNSIQNNFVMDSKTSAVLNPTQLTPIVYVDVPLKRALSKIRVKLQIDPASVVAAATTAQVSLRHFAEIGSLLNGNPYALTAGDYDNSPYVTGTSASTFTFYSYENNWATTSANETYLMVNLPYSPSSANYYRIPINKSANDIRTGKIERNMIYDVTVYINKPGTPNESGTVLVNGNCTITDWTTRNVVLQTISQHYLGISEYNIVMPNTSTFTLNYVSDLPVSITNITATCTQYSTTGTPSNVTYTSGQSQFPIFTVNSVASTITITSAIPINYVPKNMTFTVTNNQGLSLSANIIQYPPRYVTARTSTGNIKPVWNTGGTNLNLFTVNTLVPSSDGSYLLGDPTNGFAKTDSTAVGNKMVSPRFIIASQYGIYTRENYTVAQTRCFQYGEDIYRGGWRMPSKAEIELINVIQDDTNSAVKALLTGDAYWSAYKYDYYNFVNNFWINEVSTGTAFVRCVYDLYKDEQ